jgi:hypothetical protein
VDAVDVGQRAGGVGQVGDRPHIGPCPDGVGRRGHGDQTRAIAQHRLDGGRLEFAAVGIELGLPHGRPGALGVNHPRPDVGIVIQRRDDDLVAG